MKYRYLHFGRVAKLAAGDPKKLALAVIGSVETSHQCRGKSKDESPGIAKTGYGFASVAVVPCMAWLCTCLNADHFLLPAHSLKITAFGIQVCSGKIQICNLSFVLVTQLMLLL